MVVGKTTARDPETRGVEYEYTLDSKEAQAQSFYAHSFTSRQRDVSLISKILSQLSLRWIRECLPESKIQPQ